MIGGERGDPREVSLGALLWFAAGALFVFVRLAGALSIPVGGPELDALSGAWQAHTGNSDSRYLPTLLQGLAAATFGVTTSEMAARTLVLVASASVPFAFWRLGRRFGEGPALVALAVLAVDPASILFGSTAAASGFDIAVAAWLLVLTYEERAPGWLLGAAGFFAATGGGIVLPLVVGLAALRLMRREYPSPAAVGWPLGGVVVGIAAASLGFGFGWEGPTVPPLAAFGAGFDRPWSSAPEAYLALLYSTPVILGGLAAVAAQVLRCWRDSDWEGPELPLYAWFGAALLWLIAAGGSHDPAPLAAVALPAVLLLGLEVPGIADALHRVNWANAGAILAGMLLCLGVMEAYLADWARLNRPGDADEKLIITGLAVAVVACFGLLFSNRQLYGAALVPPLFAGALLLFTGASGVAFGSPDEPMPSPIATIQGEEIRAIVAKETKENGGEIVVHPSFKDAITWALRDTPHVVVADRIPAGATAVIWPVTEPAPGGYSVVEGQWSFMLTRDGPDGGFLPYLRWLTNRNSLKNVPAPLAVYLKAGQ